MAGLEALILTATLDQLRLAHIVELNLPEATPEVVAAALLRRALRTPLHIEQNQDRIPTENELAYVGMLAEQQNIDVSTDLDGVDLINAWVSYLYRMRNIRALKHLRPEPGDIVAVNHRGHEFLAEISSISASGRLNFKGGAGAGAWPNFVEFVARATDVEYPELQYAAKQKAAHWRQPLEWPGSAVLNDLSKWKIDGEPSDVSIAAFTEALDVAEDEKPLQKVLQDYPEILAHLVSSNHGAYVIPQVKFGDKYVADFMIAGMTSLGLRWTFVELERPDARLELTDGLPPKELRKGKSQIEDWKEFVQENLDYTRKRRSVGGLGLYGIRPDDRGLLIIGRASLSFDPDVRRLRVAENGGIDIRTYDWILRESRRPRLLGYGVLDIEERAHVGDPWDPFDT